MIQRRRAIRQMCDAFMRWWLVAAVSLIGVYSAAGWAKADPIDNPAPHNPYPTDNVVLATYTRVDPADFFIPGLYGVYFLSPTGLNCGIWLRGSFGCEGNLPGTPPGTDHIGWFNGDTRAHYDPFVAIGFPHVQAGSVLPPRSYINWNETTCVSTADGSTYCHRGQFRFFVTPTYTAVDP